MPEDLGKDRITAHIIEQFYDFLSKQDYGGIIKGLRGKIVAPLNGQHTLVQIYIELHAIHTKMIRSLTLVIGKSISYLFGTATESDLNTICSTVSRLAASRGCSSCCRWKYLSKQYN